MMALVVLQSCYITRGQCTVALAHSNMGRPMLAWPMEMGLQRSGQPRHGPCCTAANSGYTPVRMPKDAPASMLLAAVPVLETPTGG
jgi:hypothetical protein